MNSSLLLTWLSQHNTALTKSLFVGNSLFVACIWCHLTPWPVVAHSISNFITNLIDIVISIEDFCDWSAHSRCLLKYVVKFKHLAMHILFTTQCR